MNLLTFLYIGIIFLWIIYGINVGYENNKLKHISYKQKLRIFFTPFWLLYIMSLFYAIQRILSAPTDYSVYQYIVSIIGFIFFFLGVVFFVCLNFFIKSFPSCLSIDKGGKLGGLYKYIRHPSFYVLTFVMFGNALFFLDIYILVLACISFIFIYISYIVEENDVMKTSPYYKEYIKNSNRFLPNFIRFPFFKK